LDYNGRERLWKMAIGDAKEKRARSVKEVRVAFLTIYDIIIDILEVK
jgi:hypothetical protein